MSFLSKVKSIGKGALETAADVATVGGYSMAKEGLGFGESNSLIDRVNPLGDAGANLIRGANDYLGLVKNPNDPGAPMVVPDFGQGAFQTPEDQAAHAYALALGNSLSDSYTPGAIRDVNLAPAAMTSAAGPAPIERVTAAGAAPVSTYQAAQIADTQVDPAATAVFGGVGRTAFNADPQAEVRAGQLGDLSAIRAAAAGNGPKAGDDMYAAALGRLSDEQYALVNQASGEDKAAARNEAMLQIGRQGITAAHDAAAADAGAQQAALGMLPGAASQVRSTDVDVAGKVADLDQQANMLDAQLATAVAQGNRDAINSINAQKAQIQAAKATAQAQLQQGAAADAAGAHNTSDLDAARRADAAAAGNAGAANSAEESYAQRLDEANAKNATATNTRDVNQAQLGVNRDVSANAAGQGAFQATTGAKNAALNTAVGAADADRSAVAGKVAGNEAAYQAALDAKNTTDKRKAAAQEGNRATATKLLEML